MALSDVHPEKNKWLCEQWAKAVVELNKAFETAFGELRDHVAEISQTSPQSAIEVANYDDLDVLIGRFTEWADDERFADLAEEVRELVVRLRSVTAAPKAQSSPKKDVTP